MMRFAGCAAKGADPADDRGFVCDFWDEAYSSALVDAVLRPLGVDYLWDDCFSCTWDAHGVSGCVLPNRSLLLLLLLLLLLRTISLSHSLTHSRTRSLARSCTHAHSLARSRPLFLLHLQAV
jgi:hypothetical protein